MVYHEVAVPGTTVDGCVMAVTQRRFVSIGGITSHWIATEFWPGCPRSFFPYHDRGYWCKEWAAVTSGPGVQGR